MRKRFLAPDEKINNYSTWQLIKDIKKLVSPYKGRFILGSVLRLVADIFNLYPAYALALIVTIISTGDPTKNATKLWTLVATWIGLALIRNVLIYIAKTKIFNLSDKIQIDVEQQAITHMFKLDIAWHEHENSGNKLKRIQNASSGFNRLLHIWINNLIEITINFIGVVIVIYHFDKQLALFTSIFLVIYYIVTKLLLKRAAAASNEVNIANEEIAGLQYEAVHNIRTIKIMSMIDTLLERLKFYSEKLYQKTQIKVFWLMNRNNGSSMVGFLFKGAMMIFIINGILKGDFEVGLLVLFNGYFNRIWESVDELSGVSEDILVSRYSISRLKQIMDEPIRIDDEMDKHPFPAKWKTITLENVSFSYGNNQVLKDINFQIKRGEKIGVIGLSGAGKSTLFKLLLKEYETFEGKILIDGIPIQEISKHDYFKYIAVVLQDTEVFNFSLRENIYLAGPRTINKEVELQKALKVAHVTDFLPKLSEGVDTIIGEKGVRLSGGEKQRLGIARAVFKQPQLLLLDEATSHLDLESEEKIQDSLHQFFNNVTAVVIAHRLTTIKEMDQILVIEDGEIIESGNFAELTAKQGRFYELWEKQRL